MKIRLETNNPSEVAAFDEILRKSKITFTKSKSYPNRGNDSFRIYYDFDLSEPPVIAEVLVIEDDDSSPGDADAVLGGNT